MKISSFMSLNGPTYVVSDGFCVLGLFKSRRAARLKRIAVWRERRARR